MIRDFYNITFSVRRKSLGTGANANIQIESTISSNNKGVIRPITDISQNYNPNNYGKEFNLYCDANVDIRVGDVIVVASTRYNVHGVSVFEDILSSESHLRVKINKSN